MAKKAPRGRTRDAAPRKFKKKTSPLVIEKVEYVDYKDVDLLSRFMSDRGKFRNQKLSGNDVQQQREVANAIKIAREMGLLPYARRVASTPRGGRRDDRRDDRRSRDNDRPADADDQTTITDDTGAGDDVVDTTDAGDEEA